MKATHEERVVMNLTFTLSINDKAQSGECIILCEEHHSYSIFELDVEVSQVCLDPLVHLGIQLWCVLALPVTNGS